MIYIDYVGFKPKYVLLFAKTVRKNTGSYHSSGWKKVGQVNELTHKTLCSLKCAVTVVV